MKNEDKIKFLWDVIKRYDGYINSANTKASLILSFCTAILVGLILKTKEIIANFENIYSKHILYILIIYILIFNIKSIYHSLKAIFPQTNSYTAESSVIFYGDVSKIEKAANGYYQKIQDLTDEQVIKDLSHQIYELSQITSDKFEEIKKSVNTIKRFLLAPTIIFMIIVSIF
jgi:hypothetical protein